MELLETGKRTNWQSQLEKNIQLSEKLEYLMTSGKLVLHTNTKNQTTFLYINESMEIYKLRNGGRLLDFVNDLIEENGLYPLVQKFHLLNKK